MLCDDGNLYVVKFLNNPQHSRVLANEMLATHLANLIGLTVSKCEVIQVEDWLISSTPELQMTLGETKELCHAGLQFGSLFVGGLMPGLVVDYMPEALLPAVKNLEEFGGMLAFDKWTSNDDGRQAVFYKKYGWLRYKASFIDFGNCFGAGDWTYKDSPIRGVYARNVVYKGITSLASFEPWLERIRNISPDTVRALASAIPPEWYGRDGGALTSLLDALIARRPLIPGLICDFKVSSRNPFPNWRVNDQSEEGCYRGSRTRILTGHPL
jgi:hypothetical protein